MKPYTPTIGLEDIRPEYGGPIDISKITPDYNMGTGIASDSVTASNIDAYRSNIDSLYSTPEFVGVSPEQQISIIPEAGTYYDPNVIKSQGQFIPSSARLEPETFSVYKQPSLQGQGTGLPSVQEAMNIQPQLNPLQQPIVTGKQYE